MTEKKHLPTLRSYIIGFGLSLILTFIAFGVTVMHLNSGHFFIPHNLIIPFMLVLAMVQLIVQLVFFLHVLAQNRPHWNLILFVGTFGLVLIIVIASLWIMNHLNYNMTPQASTEYILQDEGIKNHNGKN